MLLTCASPALAQQDAAAAAKAAIKATEARMVKAFLAKDWPTVASVYADGAVLMPPNAPPVVGAQAIARFFASAPALSAFTVSSESIEIENGMATNRGAYSVTFTPPAMAAPVTDQGKYLWVLRKGSDASWRIAIDMFSSNNPPPPTPHK
jgi:ketosteroid isomerase-like protein